MEGVFASVLVVLGLCMKKLCNYRVGEIRWLVGSGLVDGKFEVVGRRGAHPVGTYSASSQMAAVLSRTIQKHLIIRIRLHERGCLWRRANRTPLYNLWLGYAVRVCGKKPLCRSGFAHLAHLSHLF